MRAQGYLLGLALLAMTAFAKEPSFVAPPPGFRIAMELELSPEAFSKLAGYFDYERLQAESGASLVKRLPDDFFDDYLRDDPQALSDLPEVLRKTLTHGLTLESTIIQNASELDSQRGLSARAIQKQGDLWVPKHVAWQKLYDRWNALDPSVKKSVVHWESLSPRKKATLAIQYAFGNLHPKASLPPEEKRLFERLFWGLDRKALEFRHRENLYVDSPSEFFHDVRLLAQRAGVERKILHPEEFYENLQNLTARAGLSQVPRSGTAGLHFHISVKGRDLTEFGNALNRLALVRRVHLGILNDLLGSGDYLYDPSARDKGLVRMIGKDRLEIRDHRIALQDELRFILKGLSLESKESIELVDAEIKKLMSNEVVDRIAKYRSSYLPDFEKYMTPEQRSRVQPVIEFSRSIERMSSARKPSKDFWRRTPALMATKDADIRSSVFKVLAQQSTWPNEVWDRVPALMTSESPQAQLALLRTLESQPVWPQKVWDQIPLMMKSEDSDLRRQIAYLVRFHPDRAKSASHCVAEILSTGLKFP